MHCHRTRIAIVAPMAMATCTGCAIDLRMKSTGSTPEQAAAVGGTLGTVIGGPVGGALGSELGYLIGTAGLAYAAHSRGRSRPAPNGTTANPHALSNRAS